MSSVYRAPNHICLLALLRKKQLFENSICIKLNNLTYKSFKYFFWLFSDIPAQCFDSLFPILQNKLS